MKHDAMSTFNSLTSNLTQILQQQVITVVIIGAPTCADVEIHVTYTQRGNLETTLIVANNLWNIVMVRDVTHPSAAKQLQFHIQQQENFDA